LAQAVQTGNDFLIGALIILFLGQIKQHFGVFKIAEILLPDADQILQLTQEALHPLGFGLVVPEIGADGLPLQQFNLFSFAL